MAELRHLEEMREPVDGQAEIDMQAAELLRKQEERHD